jgi:hypothetical protein
VISQQAFAGGAGVVSGCDSGDPGGPPGEHVQVKLTSDKVTFAIDSVELRVKFFFLFFLRKRVLTT